jgi:hypothetical protein
VLHRTAYVVVGVPLGEYPGCCCTSLPYSQPAIVVWNVSKGSVAANLKAHKYGVGALAFSPDSNTLASAGYQVRGCALLVSAVGVRCGPVLSWTGLCRVGQYGSCLCDGNGLLTVVSTAASLCYVPPDRWRCEDN